MGLVLVGLVVVAFRRTQFGFPFEPVWQLIEVGDFGRLTVGWSADEATLYELEVDEGLRIVRRDAATGVARGVLPIDRFREADVSLDVGPLVELPDGRVALAMKPHLIIGNWDRRFAEALVLSFQHPGTSAEPDGWPLRCDDLAIVAGWTADGFDAARTTPQLAALLVPSEATLEEGQRPQNGLTLVLDLPLAADVETDPLAAGLVLPHQTPEGRSMHSQGGRFLRSGGRSYAAARTGSQAGWSLLGMVERPAVAEASATVSVVERHISQTLDGSRSWQPVFSQNWRNDRYNVRWSPTTNVVVDESQSNVLRLLAEERHDPSSPASEGSPSLPVSPSKSIPLAAIPTSGVLASTVAHGCRTETGGWLVAHASGRGPETRSWQDHRVTEQLVVHFEGSLDAALASGTPPAARTWHQRWETRSFKLPAWLPFVQPPPPGNLPPLLPNRIEFSPTGRWLMLRRFEDGNLIRSVYDLDALQATEPAVP